jgi:hypothetical protein
MEYKDPVTGRKRKAEAIYKVKFDGKWVILVETKTTSYEFNYDAFAEANHGFKSYLS